MSFDWSLMRSFLAVMEHGSLLGAARALRSSQPTIGRHVSALERQLGVALFERTGRSLLPTAAARTIAQHAQGMGRGAEAIAAAVVRAGSRLEGTVRLSASQIAANYLLPGLIARLRILEPGIQIELVATNGLSNLLRREADIAVRMVQPRQASLLARRVATVPIGAYAAGEYLRRRGAPRFPADLLAHDLVGFDTDDSLLRGFASQGVVVERRQFAVRTDDHVVAWHAVCAGAGIGFNACYVGSYEPRVQRVLPELPIAPLPMWLAVHREIRGSARIRRVFDFLAASLPQQVAELRPAPQHGT